MSFCVVLLTMNEEPAVALQIDELRAKLGPDAPILIVDSSSDRTPEIAAAKGVRVLRQFPPVGYGKAMKLAQMTAAADCDVVVTMDCDLTYPADKVPELVRLIEQDGWDCVSGARISGSNEGMPLLNRIGNIVFAALARAMFGIATADLTTGMRAYRASVITSIEWVPLRFFPAEQAIRIHQAGYRMTEIPVGYAVRIGEVKMQKLRDTLALLKAFWHCWRVPVTVTG